jgi:hypothetical protein
MAGFAAEAGSTVTATASIDRRRILFIGEEFPAGVAATKPQKTHLP